MNTHPITLTPDQVQAALAGRLTQIRMPVQEPHQTNWHTMLDDGQTFWEDSGSGPVSQFCPWGVVGDRLTCEAVCPNLNCEGTGYDSAYEPFICDVCKGSGEPGITLELLAVRVERLADMTEADALACGCKAGSYKYVRGSHTAKNEFEVFWKEQHGQRHPWSLSPWVWVLDVRRVEGGENK